MKDADEVRARFVGLGADGRLPKHQWMPMSGIQLCRFCAQDEVRTGRESVCPARVMAMAEAGELAMDPAALAAHRHAREQE